MKKLKSFREIPEHLDVPVEAVDFLLNINTQTPNGRYEFGERCFVNVMDASMTERTVRRAETHDQYVDVQCLITGRERIYVIAREKLTPETPYDEGKDVTFYPYGDADEILDFSAGECVILDPSDAHHPGCAIGEPSVEKKAVMKVRKG